MFDESSTELQYREAYQSIRYAYNRRHLYTYFQASPSQLSEATNCIFAKTSTLGFTHFLAETVTRIRQVYLNLSKPAPAQLLEDSENNYLLEFLNGLTHALREDHTILRVTGVWAMGTIATLSLMICPEDTLLSVEQIVLHRGSRQNVLIDITNSDASISNPDSTTLQTFHTHFRLEKPINGANELRSVANVVDNKSISRSYAVHHIFSWDAWLLDTAKLRCMECGIDFPEVAASKVADIIARMHHSFHFFDEGSKEGSQFPSPTFADLLGADADTRLSTFCYQTLHARPYDLNSSIEELARILLDECMKQEPTGHTCSDLWAIEWRKEQLVRDLAFVALDGFLAVFLEPGKNVTITSRRWFAKKRNLDSENARNFEVTSMDQHVEDFCTILRHLDKVTYTHDLNEMIFGLLKPTGIPWLVKQRGQNNDWAYPESFETFGLGNECCILYPAVLDELQLQAHTGLRFRFEAGHFVFNNRRYQRIRSNNAPSLKSLPLKFASILPWPFRPSNIGQHDDDILTCYERFDAIELHVDVRTNGSITTLNLPYIVAASSVLETLAPCSHPKDEPLSFDDAFHNPYDSQVYFLGVDTVWAKEQVLMDRSTPRIAFSLTRGNLAAQFYSLAMLNQRIPQKLPEKIFLWRAFFQGDCCMKCAIERCQFEYHGAFIVLD